MTWHARELAAAGVDPRVIEARQWRRRVARLTIAELARMLGMSESTLQEIETGGKPMPPDWPERLGRLRAEWSEAKRPPRPPETRGRRRKKASPSP